MTSGINRGRTAGRVLQVGQGVAAYRAFVPDALPPALVLDVRLLGALSEADRALGELAGLGRTLPNPNLLIQPLVRVEAVLSSRIEGTHTGVADLYAYEGGHVGLPGQQVDAEDAREVANYVTALTYGLERLPTLPVSLRLIRELHARLMEGVRGGQLTPGEFRRSQNWIGPPGCTLNDARYVPPPAPEMLEALDAFEKYVHVGDAADAYPPLIRLALIHYQFEAIHPFLDGNGRIGRLLVILLLVHWQLLPHPLLHLSAFFESHRREYYDVLLAVSERAAWNEWVRFFLRGVAEQARDAISRVRRLQDLQRDWHERLLIERVSTSVLRLADGLLAQPVLSVPQAQALLGVTYRSANLTMQKLVAAGLVRPLSEARYGRVFVADEVLRAIGED